MKIRFLVLFLAVFGGSLRVVADESKVQSHVISRFGESANPDGSRRLFIYSVEPLNCVRYKVATEETWSWMENAGSVAGYHAYGTPITLPVTIGGELQVVGVTNKKLQLQDQLTIQENLKVQVTSVSEVQLTEMPPEAQRPPLVLALDSSTIHYGAAHVDPQTLAQARANEMARRNSMTHLGGGIVRTSIGTLAEGIGMGGPNCHTCTATNGTAAVGDGQAVGANGMTYRCRLYNSPGTMSGSFGGGWGRRRR